MPGTPNADSIPQPMVYRKRQGDEMVGRCPVDNCRRSDLLPRGKGEIGTWTYFQRGSAACTIRAH